jgi:predicted ribosome quality control (RQC) complex YloA/Tae2 family protein
MNKINEKRIYRMSFDGIFTKLMTEEIASSLISGRINKIYQPYKNEIILLIRANGKNHKLLLSAHSSYARVQLTQESYDNPNEPPMFCMLLRKHIEGAIIENIYQIGLDRMIAIEVKGRNELGDITYKKLVIEIMGRHSNILLVDKEKNMILDSIKHISFAVNSHRAILPGQPYILPPQQEKLDPFTVQEIDILRKLDFNAGKLDKQLVEHFAGLSPLIAREIIFRSGLANRVTLPKAFIQIMEQIQKGAIQPSITINATKEAFYFLPLENLKGETKTFSSLSDVLDRFYFGKAERDRVKQQASDLERFIQNEKDKNQKKIDKLLSTLESANKAEEYQLLGELLTANMYLLRKGMKEIKVENYYAESGETITILLDPMKSPSENAQKYFSKYQKAKNSIEIVKEQIRLAEAEHEYFDLLQQQLMSASIKDIAEIREELIEEGYIRDRQKKKPKLSNNGKPQLESYFSSDGTEILVGKNNKQNDYLTNKFAGRDEIWLHTKDIPGSHVVIRSKNPEKQTLIEAASLAAYFSKAKLSSSVPVDYTKVRYVKKPAGAKPGFVIYENQQTVYVTPDEEKVLSLKVK